MALANRITGFRIALAPGFALLFSCVAVFPVAREGLLIALWVLFLISEFSDIADGWVARKFNQTSDLGKLLDPFSDVISRLTFFLCFLLAGFVPLWFFLIVMYRELSMTFLRLLLIQKGTVQGASSGGKFKAVLYFLVSLAGMLLITFPELAPDPVVYWALQALLVVAAAISLASFWQYFRSYRSAP